MKKNILLLCFLVFGTEVFADECTFKSLSQCYTCDNLLSFRIGNPNLCEKLCPNRELNYANTGSHSSTANCVLKKCPDNAPLRDTAGSCYACDTLWEYVPENDITNCEVCANRHLDEKGNCLLNDQVSIKPHWAQYKNDPHGPDNVVCPKDTPLKSWNNLCYSCNISDEIRVDTECIFEKNKECNEVCAEREILTTVGGNPPSVLKCPKDSPLMDTVGMCWSCEVPEDINLEYNAWKCLYNCYGKRYLNGYTCKSCNPKDYKLDYNACMQCNKAWIDGECMD